MMPRHAIPAAARARAAVLACLLLALGACTPATQRIEAPANWSAHVAAVSARTDWTLQGKIGVRAQSGSGSAFLSWQQQPAGYRLVLSGALGLGKLVLTGNDRGVAWTDSRGRSGQHPDPDALVAEIWGWQLPVAALQYWIRGIPHPDRRVEDATFVNDEATQFRQSGWLVEPTAYRDVDGLSLPSRIRIAGEGATLTVLVNRWGAAP